MLYKCLPNRMPILFKTSRILLNKNIQFFFNNNDNNSFYSENTNENINEKEKEMENEYAVEFEPSLDYNIEKYKDE